MPEQDIQAILNRGARFALPVVGSASEVVGLTTLGRNVTTAGHEFNDVKSARSGSSRGGGVSV